MDQPDQELTIQDIDALIEVAWRPLRPRKQSLQEEARRDAQQALHQRFQKRRRQFLHRPARGPDGLSPPPQRISKREEDRIKARMEEIVRREAEWNYWRLDPEYPKALRDFDMRARGFRKQLIALSEIEYASVIYGKSPILDIPDDWNEQAWGGIWHTRWDGIVYDLECMKAMLVRSGRGKAESVRNDEGPDAEETASGRPSSSANAGIKAEGKPLELNDCEIVFDFPNGKATLDWLEGPRRQELGIIATARQKKLFEYLKSAYGDAGHVFIGEKNNVFHLRKAIEAAAKKGGFMLAGGSIANEGGGHYSIKIPMATPRDDCDYTPEGHRSLDGHPPIDETGKTRPGDPTAKHDDDD